MNRRRDIEKGKEKEKGNPKYIIRLGMKRKVWNT
jgi:hypothetical protein